MSASTKSSRSESDGRSSPRAEALLAAAESILVEDGYDALSARAVAERAGMNKALVFYYFGSLADLLGQMLARYYDRHLEMVGAAFSTEGDRRARVHAVIDALFDFMSDNRAYARVIQQQVASGGPHAPLAARHLAQFVDLTRSMLGDILPETGALSATHFYHSVSGLVTMYFNFAPALGVDQLGRDPLSPEVIAERRQHVHWTVDAWLDALERQGAALSRDG